MQNFFLIINTANVNYLLKSKFLERVKNSIICFKNSDIFHSF